MNDINADDGNTVTSVDDSPLEVVDFPGRGRGLVATKDIKKDTMFYSELSEMNCSYRHNEWLACVWIAVSLLKTRVSEKQKEENAGNIKMLLACHPRDTNDPAVEQSWISTFDQTMIDDTWSEEEQNDLEEVIQAQPQTLKLVCAKIRLNCYIHDVASGIAVAMFKMSACMNHSCRPNTHYKIRVSGTQSLINFWSVRDIKKGEEITHNYLSSLEGATVYHRQVTMLNSYQFKCRCEKCLEEGGDDITL